MQDPKSVERLRHGDASTLKRLFKANHAKLYPIAYRLTGNRDVAGEAIRQAFRQLWDNRSELDVFDTLGLRLVEYTYAQAMAYREEHGITGFAVSPDADAIGNGHFPEIADLTPEDQLNYLLLMVDGYSFRELARAYGTTIEEVQLSLGRAIASLSETSAK